jgi:hypothetical protein
LATKKNKETSNAISSIFDLVTEDKVQISDEGKQIIEEAVFVITKEKDAQIKNLTKEGKAKDSVLKEAKASILSLRNKKGKEIQKLMEEFEKDTMTKIDNFLDYTIDKKLLPDNIAEAVATVEVVSPLLEGIKSTFADKGIELDTKGHGLLKEAQNEISSLKSKLNEKQESLFKTEEAGNKLLAEVQLNRLTNGMTESQKNKMKVLFEGSSYDEINERFKGVCAVVISESGSNNNDKAQATSQTTLTEDEVVESSEAKTLEEAYKNKDKDFIEQGTQYLT